jgi:hypothetical protein
LGAATAAVDLVADLLNARTPGRGWPGSPLLLQPRRHPQDESLGDVGPHVDVHALVSTAMACLALSLWAHRAPS